MVLCAASSSECCALSTGYSPRYVDRELGILGSYYNTVYPKAYSIFLMGDDILLDLCWGNLKFDVSHKLAPESPRCWACKVHILRRNLYSKHKLIMDLEHFDLRTAECRVDFDKTFVCDSIAEWYGSTAAFNAYVRGPFAAGVAQIFLQFPDSVPLLRFHGVAWIQQQFGGTPGTR